MVRTPAQIIPYNTLQCIHNHLLWSFCNCHNRKSSWITSWLSLLLSDTLSTLWNEAQQCRLPRTCQDLWRPIAAQARGLGIRWFSKLPCRSHSNSVWYRRSHSAFPVSECFQHGAERAWSCGTKTQYKTILFHSWLVFLLLLSHHQGSCYPDTWPMKR